MQYTYLNGSNVYIYPSANAEDGGNINKEVNIAGLVTSVVPKDYIVSYKLRDPNVAHESLEVDLAAGLSPTEFNLYSGQVVLNGRSVELSFDPDGTNYQTFDLNVLYDGDITSTSTLYLLIVPFFAASGNILGDSYQNVGGAVSRECKGVALTAVNSLTGLGLDHYVVVGKFNLVSGSITGYTVEEESYKVFSDEKVKQVGLNSLNTGVYNILLTPINPESGQDKEVYYLEGTSKFYIGDRGQSVYTKSMKHILDYGKPLQLTYSSSVGSFINSELSTDSEGNVIPNYNCYPCTTESSIANKDLKFYTYHIPTTGTLIKVRFTNSNTADNPTLKTHISAGTSSSTYAYRPIYLQDGRVCPWYAISETTAIYEFVYDGNNSRWILLNPSAPTLNAQYTKIENSTTYIFNVNWSELNGCVSGRIQWNSNNMPVGEYDFSSGSPLPVDASLPDIVAHCGTYEIGIPMSQFIYNFQVLPSATKAQSGRYYRYQFEFSYEF